MEHAGKLAEANEPFKVLNPRGPAQIFLDFICKRYGYRITNQDPDTFLFPIDNAKAQRESRS